MPSISHRVGTPNERHNIDPEYRKSLKNVDPELTKYNEVIISKSVEEIYQEFLQPAYEEYNNRQVRRERRFDVKWNAPTALDYQKALDHAARQSQNNIGQKGKPPVRELVVQFGNPQQGFGCKDQISENRELSKSMIIETFIRAEQRYPQFAWGNAVFHADEVSVDANQNILGSYHGHREFVPLCYKNKQGIAVQVGMERCLKEMGFETFEEWKLDFDNLMEEVLESYNLTRIYMNNHEEHIESKEFHRQQEKKRLTLKLERERAEAELKAEEAKTERLKMERLRDEIKKNNEEDLRSAELLKTRCKELSEDLFELQVASSQMREEILQEIDEAYSETIEFADSDYKAALVYIANCDDEEFERISDEGVEMISYATDNRKATLDEKLAAFKSAENDRKISWEERQKAWEEYKIVSADFWDLRSEYMDDLKYMMSKQYDERRSINRDVWWAKRFLHQYPFLIGRTIAAVYLCVKLGQRYKYDAEIRKLKKEQKKLKKLVTLFARDSRYWRDALKKGKSPNIELIEKTKALLEKLDNETEKYVASHEERVNMYLQKKKEFSRMYWDEKYATIQMELCRNSGDYRKVAEWQEWIKFRRNGPDYTNSEIRLKDQVSWADHHEQRMREEVEIEKWCNELIEEYHAQGYAFEHDQYDVIQYKEQVKIQRDETKRAFG